MPISHRETESGALILENFETGDRLTMAILKEGEPKVWVKCRPGNLTKDGTDFVLDAETRKALATWLLKE